MAADHLVEGVAPGTGVQAVVDAVITQLDVPVTAAAGVEATFEDEWLDFTKDIDGGAALGFSVEGDNISLYRDLLANTGINVEFEGVSLVDVLDLAFGTEAEFAGTVESAKAVTAGTGSTAEFSGKNLDGHADAGIGVNVAVDGYALTDALSAGAGSQAAMQRFAEYNRAVTAACGTLASFDGFNWTAFLRTCKDRITIRYTLQLTGGDGPITIPISSFQGRFRSGDPSYLSVNVPGNNQYDDIVARSSGDLILSMHYLVDGVVFYTEILMEVDLESISLDQGSSSTSITLSGHRTTTYTQKRTTLTGNSYKALDNGKYRYRCIPDLYLRPGDLVTVGEDEFTADVVSWYANPTSFVMEVSEE
jgi:hypothetical protein